MCIYLRNYIDLNIRIPDIILQRVVHDNDPYKSILITFYVHNYSIHGNNYLKKKNNNNNKNNV